uniref:GH18 domain-containing protein n=1 Tax=Arcella intermedia TaxID=1963864 RepID=A0A6B2LBC6_9EUKA
MSLVGGSPLKVFGYLPEWRYVAERDWEAVCCRLTHLIYFSIEVLEDGTFTALDRLPPPDFESIVKAASTKCNTKMIISFGGYGRTNGFPGLVLNAASRRNFINNIVSLLQSHSWDGVDLNWEYPTSQSEWSGLFQLCEELNREFKPRSWEVSMALYPGQERLLTPQAIHNVHYFHMMTYDQHGQHSTMDFYLKSLQAIKNANLPLHQFTLGVPFYGRNIETGQWETYDQILQNNPSLSTDKDQVGKIYFNGLSTIQKKVLLAQEHQFGGIMIWEIGQDTDPKNPLSLLNAISTLIEDPKSKTEL